MCNHRLQVRMGWHPCVPCLMPALGLPQHYCSDNTETFSRLSCSITTSSLVMAVLYVFRSVRQGDNTGVDLVCTYRKEPSSPDLDRVGLYHEVSNKTRAITRLGPYSLNATSLYVNGEQSLSCCLPLAASSGPPPSPH